MDTKQLKQRAVGSGTTVNNGMKNKFAATQAAVRHIDWRLGDAGRNEKPSLEENGSGLDDLLEDEGLLHIEEADGTLIVSGDLDLHQAPAFREQAEKYIHSTPNPRLDISRVPFLDSAGLATLLALSRLAKEQNKAVRLIAAGSPRRVLKITGIDRVLLLED
jgi:anti-anti-sigma factor